MTIATNPPDLILGTPDLILRGSYHVDDTLEITTFPDRVELYVIIEEVGSKFVVNKNKLRKALK